MTLAATPSTAVGLEPCEAGPGDWTDAAGGLEDGSDATTRLRIAPAVELLFVAGDPPRHGAFVAYVPFGEAGPLVAGLLHRAAGSDASEVLRVPDPPDGEPFEGLVEIVCPAPKAPRRTEVLAHQIGLETALPWLVDLDELWRARASVAAWSTVVVAGLGLLARGRLFPAVSPGGWDAWRAGPLDPADHRLLDELAASLPPSAHCLPTGKSSPMRIMSPEFAVRAMWDAMADFMVRTPAASAIAGGDLFAAGGTSAAGHLAGWLADSSRHPEGAARVGLRVVLDGAIREDDDATRTGEDTEPEDTEPEDTEPEDTEPEDTEPEGTQLEGTGSDGEPAWADDDAGPVAVVQMTSVLDPSLVVDAADLLSMPEAVASRLDPDAETNLLLALRRGSRVWAPLGALLYERVPSALPLAGEDVEDLLGDGGDALRAVGIEVLWPSSLLADGLALQATVKSQREEGDGTFSLHEMVKFDWRLALGGELLSEEELEHLAEAKRSIVRLRGRWVHVDQALVARARERRERRMSAIEALAAAMAGQTVVDGETVPVVAEGAIASLVGTLRRIGDDGPALLGKPPGLVGELRPYQERGVAWLHQMCELGLGGCLADDMGLGKTVQVIGLHLHRTAGLRKKGTTKKGTAKTTTAKTTTAKTTTAKTTTAGANALIVCPTSLLGNWVRELRRFAPTVPVRHFYGAGRTLDELRPDEVVVTTYGIARRDSEQLCAAGFSLVVADEAQHAKNPLSGTARALRAIGGRNRIALTGTPVENRLSELWSILDWTTPGLLGPLERFRTHVALPVERRHDPEATQRLTRTVRPFLLRRKKTDPAIAPDLPPRTVTDRVVALTPEQVTLYEAEVREALAAIGKKKGFERQGLVFRMMTVLKQICNHPAQYLHQSAPIAGRSGKLAALEELLGVIVEEGESALVFSQYVEMLSLVEARLSQLGLGTVFLHGSVPPRRRDEMVAAFQSGRVPVFLLSLKAGGVGLNLTRATHVVHYDRWWNPAVEDQATDRAHRIGQDRPVQVHRLVTEGTLEDRIAELLERKRVLAETVVGEGEAWITEMSDAELAELVRLGTS